MAIEQPTYPITTSGLVDHISAGVAAASAPHSLDVLHVIGHSGANAAGMRYRWTTQLARALKASEFNIARDGAIAYRGNSTHPAGGTNSGGWAGTLHRLHPMRTELDYGPRTAGPYPAMSRVAIVFRGLNDFIYGGSTMKTFHEAVTAEILRLRAGAVFQEDHSSVAYSGTVVQTTPGSDTGRASDGGWKRLDTLQTITITVPADFPGGEVVLGQVVGGNGLLHFNADVAVDGNAHGTWNGAAAHAKLAGENEYSPYCYRVTGLAPGAHTITVTMTAKGTYGGFDYWSIQAPKPPLVVLPKMWRLIDANIYGVTDANIVTVNTAVQALADQFADGNVVTIDLDPALDKNSLLFSDMVHPNEDGHERLASHVYRELAPLIAERDLAWSMAMPWHYFGEMNEVAIENGSAGTTWYGSSFLAGSPRARWRVNGSGETELDGLFQPSALNNTMFTLPDYARPRAYTYRPATGYSGSAYEARNIIALTTGVVRQVNGTINAGFVDLGGVSWPT